jgi:hypothetical protein
MEITVRNVNQAFSEVFWRLKAHNLKPEQTRNGPVLAFPEPVTTTYTAPEERVLFHSGRDANPIFHVLESIWILAGRRDVAFLQQFNSRIGNYSDDGITFNAAYGYRMRHHFGCDQLVEIIKLLRREPTSRQAVVQLWDPADLTQITKDKACNTEIIFDARNLSGLNMTVFNRSNDIWWGAYGANAVHFSILQEFVAQAVKMRVGVYRQVSNNFHLYTELYDAQKYVDQPFSAEDYDYYSQHTVEPLPLMVDANYEQFLIDCETFCRDPFNMSREYKSPFITHVARPMAMVSRMRKTKESDGRYYAAQIRAEDWRTAVFEWIGRRDKN